MKRISILCLTALMCLSTYATPKYLIETGEDGDATWSVSIAGVTKVNLKTAEKTLDEWMNEEFASNGYETWLAAGTYTISSGITCTFASIKLYGGFAGTETATSQRVTGDKPWEMTNATVLDADSKRLYVSDKNPQSLWDGLTIINSVGGTGVNGGVARITTNANIRNCRFINNSSSNQGGALFTSGHSGVQITDCYFENNVAAQGGAIYVYQSSNANTYLINHCSFKGNNASNTGGAIHFQNMGTYSVKACVFDGNSATSNGSAIYSAITDASSSIKIENSLFMNNTTKVAVYLSKGDVLNNTFAKNTNGALYMNNASAVGNVKNNIIWGATNGQCYVYIENNSNYTLSHNALGLVDLEKIKVDTTGMGNRLITPGNTSYFRRPSQGDYHLCAGAAEPIAGKGLDLSSSDDITTDLDGATRSTHDIGCYIYQIGPDGCSNCFYVCGE